MRIKFLILSLLFVSLSCIADIGIPAIHDAEQIVQHKYYTLKYNEDREQADWVAYTINREMILAGKAKRKNKFCSDPSVSTGSATPKDYYKSGFDRGHLCPAAAMKISQKAMLETFYMSNMSPQKPSFNRGIWKKLESKVRKWAVKNGRIFVVTGPVFYKNNEHGEIGKNGVDIPDAYFKVVLDYREPGLKAIAFILPNQKSKKPISAYAVTVDQAEAITGIDFFPELPDNIEDKLEKQCNYNKWYI